MFRPTKKNIIYSLILLVPFVVFFFRSDIFSPLRFQLIKFTAVPARILSLPFKEIKKFVFYRRTFEEYRRLKYETDLLKARLIGMEEVIKENTRLDQLLQFKRKLIYSSIPADIIARNPSQWNSALIINKGTEDGIKQGQAVVNALGIVGKITEVADRYAKVILLTDPQFSVTALVQRPRESVLITGSLKGLCRVKYADENADIRVGDKVITSKLSVSFPDSLFIGEVVEVTQAPYQAEKGYVVHPAVNFSQLEEVLVIIGNQ